MTDFNQKTHDTDVGSHGGQSRQMMEVFENQEFGSIRLLQEAGKTFFCASDVAKALGYVNPYAAVKRHCRGPLTKREGVVQKVNQYGDAGEQVVEISFITEGDVYRLIVHSKLPSAERFEHWVFDEVLPSIRKHGVYMSDSILDQVIQHPEVIYTLAQELVAEREQLEGKVLDDELMEQTVESIKQIGVVSPLIVRPDPEGGFEILSGHRRLHAAQLAGLETVPVIVKEMDDDAAIIFMVDSNLQRENILPSERAFSYKMKLEAMKHQGTRNDLETTSRQVVGKLEAADTIGEQTGESGRQVQRFIRLTNLIPEILDMVDEKKIAFNPAVELSYLKPSEQKEFLEAMDYAQASPSLSQAQRLKKLSQEGGCTLDAMCEVMNEIKKDELDHVTIKNEVLRKYFPKSYTPKQMQDTIIRLLEKWQRSKQRDMER